ncbi:MAG: twin-arginine translocase subunit TatC [Bacteroidaceae bacterium]|nr:twin-arginine translocase subunit TatC [Bacteroidaceae bacterium]
MTAKDGKASFWEHLDILRAAILRTLAVWSVFSILAFILKEQLFDVVLAPKSPDFVTYRALDALCARFGLEAPAPFHVQLINTGLAQQFIIHMRTAFCAGVVLTAPFALYQLFCFVAPGLYSHERKYVTSVVVSGYIMFLLGALLSYYIIFPLTFQFLGTYQVADDVVNMISLDSYMSTFILMGLCMGVVFELPVLAWLLAKMGLLSASMMTGYRKHSIVVILTVAAIITPTSDVFTLLVVSLPIWLLYEVSVLIVRSASRKRG